LNIKCGRILLVNEFDHVPPSPYERLRMLAVVVIVKKRLFRRVPRNTVRSGVLLLWVLKGLSLLYGWERGWVRPSGFMLKILAPGIRAVAKDLAGLAVAELATTGICSVAKNSAPIARLV